MTRALAEPNFDEFKPRPAGPDPRHDDRLTSYRKEWPYPVGLPRTAAERRRWRATIAASGGRQLHVAETEK